MADLMSPYNILAAFNRIEKELPALVGAEGWSKTGEELIMALGQLRSSSDTTEQEELADNLIDLLSEYGQARARLNAEIQVQAAVKDELAGDIMIIANRLVGISTDDPQAFVEAAYYPLGWSFDPEDLAKLDPERRITIKPGGLKGGKSIKFSNVHLDLGEMSEMGAGALLLGYDAITKSHPLVMVAGVLLTIRALTKAMTVELSEQEASVFWGFVQSRDRENSASNRAIFEQTNVERQRYGLDALTEAQFKYAMIMLEQLKCIEKVGAKPDSWRIIEQYKIRN